MRQRFGRQDETGQELRIRLDHALRDLTPAQRIDLAMVLMAEGVAALRQDHGAGVQRASDAPTLANTPTPFLTVKQAGTRYHVGVTRLYGLVNSGTIPSITLGRRRLVRAEAIEAWLIEQER